MFRVLEKTASEGWGEEIKSKARGVGRRDGWWLGSIYSECEEKKCEKYLVR